MEGDFLKASEQYLIIEGDCIQHKKYSALNTKIFSKFPYANSFDLFLDKEKNII